jgi:pyruvate formate lyase activating enzyme
MAESPQAVIFNVQRFSIHDGPGIRTTVFFKGCPLRCRWCQNPESLRPQPELAFYRDRCRDLGECISGCPRGALRRGPERVDRDLCDACGDCVSRCPHGALKVVGRQVSLEELVGEVLRDEPFYRATGGGVTLSGGEATLQLEFVAALARRLGGHGVGVGLQTCGVFSWQAFAPHVPLFEFIHYDLKVMDRDAHRELAGGDNRGILENARHLVAAGAPVVFRLPVVPGFTDARANLEEVAAFLRELGVEHLHLLPYHAMGEIKSARLGWTLPPLEIADELPVEESVRRAVELLGAQGVTAERFEER